MNRFLTLLRREWLQHRLGWLVIVAVPPLVALLLLLVGHLSVEIDDRNVVVELGRTPALPLAVAAIAGTALASFGLAWLASLFLSPGLARRDVQDRSIEFWLSLPVGHAAGVGAPLLAHLLLFPLAALGIGLASGFVVSTLLVVRFLGLGEWAALPWGWVLAVTLTTVLRTALGLVLASFWIAPIVGLAMAASAWLRRWGIPALVLGTVVVGQVLQRFFGQPLVSDLLGALVREARGAFVQGGPGSGLILPSNDALEAMKTYPAWALHDAGQAVAALAQPLSLLVAALAAASFALLVLRRRQGG